MSLEVIDNELQHIAIQMQDCLILCDRLTLHGRQATENERVKQLDYLTEYFKLKSIEQRLCYIRLTIVNLQ